MNSIFARKSLRSHKSWAPLTWRAPLHSALTFSHSDLLPHSLLDNSSQPCVKLSRLIGSSLVPISLKRVCFRCLSPQHLTPQWDHPAPPSPWFSSHCAPIFVTKKTKTSEKITFKQSRSPPLGVRWSTSAGFSASTRPSIGAGRRFPRALEWDSGLVHQCY